MNSRKFLGGVGLLAALTLTACGGGGEEAPAGGEGSAEGAAQTLQVSADPSGAFGFAPAELSATAGQQLTVEFENPASAGQPHNWVLVEQGQEQAVATAALPNQGNVPAGTEGVIAAGEVVQAGNSEEITVDSPLEAGTYSYICTFPGHYPQMQGTLTVQ